MKVGIVLLYGSYNPTRLDYKGYLDFVSQKVKQEGIEKLVLCGGFTDPNNPTISEASTAKDYLSTIIKDFDGYVLEEHSINTNQNLQFSVNKINEGDELIVFCDLIRMAKVIWIAQYFLLKIDYKDIYKSIFEYAHAKNYYLPFINQNLVIIGYEFPGKTKEEIIAQSFAALIDVMALYSEEFEKIDLEQRKKDFGLV